MDREGDEDAAAEAVAESPGAGPWNLLPQPLASFLCGLASLRETSSLGTAGLHAARGYDTSMRRLLPLTILALVLGGVGYWIYIKTAAPEVRVGWFLDGMIDNFNRSRPGACADGLSEEFRDESSGAGRQEIHGFLVQLYFRARDPETKEFLYHVVSPAEERKIDIGDDPSTAQVGMAARFYETRRLGEAVTEKLVWEVRIDADLREGEDGWKVERTTHKTTHGERMR